MAAQQSYKLLENGEPAEEGEEEEDFIEVGKSRAGILEFLRRFFAPVHNPTTPIFPFRIWLFILSGMFIAIAIIWLAINALAARDTPAKDVLQYIDPLVGTGPGGHVFAGATLPFGMAKAVADVVRENHAGFASNESPVEGFSSLHDSGTGGASSLGNFPLFIHASCPEMSLCSLDKSGRATRQNEGSVVARPGYFAIELYNGIKAEMTAAEHATLFKFTLNTSALNPVITLDGSDLPGTNGPRALYVNQSSGRMTGEGTFNPSFGKGTYQAYTCVDIQGAAIQDVGTFNKTAFSGLTATEANTQYYGPKQGVYARFSGNARGSTIMARVGLSFLSIDRACENAEREIPDWDFDGLVQSAEDAWRKKMGPITLSPKLDYGLRMEMT